LAGAGVSVGGCVGELGGDWDSDWEEWTHCAE